MTTASEIVAREIELTPELRCLRIVCDACDDMASDWLRSVVRGTLLSGVQLKHASLNLGIMNATFRCREVELEVEIACTQNNCETLRAMKRELEAANSVSAVAPA